jgi:hypothetical protein
MALTIYRGQQVSRWQLFPNDWNPNSTSLIQQSAIRESLGEFGQVADLIVWPHPNPPPAIATRGASLYQVIDGEHRLQEYQKPDDQVFVNVVHGLTLEQAMRLTIVMDYTKGSADPLLLLHLLTTLKDEIGPEQTFRSTPFNDADLDHLLRQAAPPPAPLPLIAPTQKATPLSERWHHRTLAFPDSASTVIDAVIDSINAHRPLHRDPAVALGQTLEFLAAEYLSSVSNR